jgi:hypothetical protein
MKFRNGQIGKAKINTININFFKNISNTSEFFITIPEYNNSNSQINLDFHIQKPQCNFQSSYFMFHIILCFVLSLFIMIMIITS